MTLWVRPFMTASFDEDLKGPRGSRSHARAGAGHVGGAEGLVCGRDVTCAGGALIAKLAEALIVVAADSFTPEARDPLRQLCQARHAFGITCPWRTVLQ
jgi:hypothetical protein